LVVAFKVWLMDAPLLLLEPLAFEFTTVHPYVVPLTLLLLLNVVADPEQMLADVGLTVITGMGFTVATLVIGDPEQLFAVAVMEYVTVPLEVDVAVSVWLMLFPVPADEPLAADDVLVQANVVPLTAFGLVIEKAATAPEQIETLAGVAFIVGNGFTVTMAVMGDPEHPPATGVIVYVAVPAVFVVAVSVVLIVAPVPETAPLTLTTAGDQLKVVPLTVLGFVIERAAGFPEQIDFEVAAAFGIGLTVTTVDTGFPAQPLATGVIV
jgi:hypothetical protein